MESKLLTLKSVVETLGVSYAWMDRKAREEKIKVIWLGGKRYVHRDELDRIYKEGIA